MVDVIDAYEGVKILDGGEEQMPFYIVVETEFTQAEKKLISDSSRLSDTVIPNYRKVMHELSTLHSSQEKEDYLINYLRERISKLKIKAPHLDELVTIIIDKVFLGYGRLGPLMRDDQLEEIMVNGVNEPVFVVHRRHGMCATNLSYDSMEPLMSMINWLANYVDRKIDEENPLLDAHMPDGSRANVAIAPAAPYGPAVTIRKFRKVPFTIFDLIDRGSLTTELAAFLWVCVEGFGLAPRDILIAGGAGSGKTTLLNALAMFIPRTERIVTVEDTLELNFDFIQNWVPMEASVMGAKTASRITMQDLLRNSLRMRPDRVMVGEVRSSEAETLFVAMDIGLDGSMGTIHANNARETTIRLIDEPMNVPLRMMPLLDLIIVTNRIYDRTRGLIRRVTQVSEVAGIEKDIVQLGDIYQYDLKDDFLKRTDYPILLNETLAKKCGITKKRLQKEYFIREKILDYMMANDIRGQKEVLDMFQRFHKNPKEVISMVKEYYDIGDHNHVRP